jgi:hypothetical protein
MASAEKNNATVARLLMHFKDFLKKQVTGSTVPYLVIKDKLDQFIEEKFSKIMQFFVKNARSGFRTIIQIRI